jgi:1-hydroxycarotenoid 3,4-desaturase
VAKDTVVIVGGGIGGLSAAIDLSARGVPVIVLERAARPGGKMREVPVGSARIDGGPTVFTMRWVFDQLLDQAGTSLEAEVALERADILARHAWSDTERLDLYCDAKRSADAIAAFSGPEEGRRFLSFCKEIRAIYKTLEMPFLCASRPTMTSLPRRIGITRVGEMMRLRPMSSMWAALGDHFTDERLRQLFGRYATYCGSSPYLAPATLMLVAHVEQEGVWYVKGGMYRLAEALARVAARLGADIRCESEVAEIVLRAGRVGGVRLADGEVIEAAAVVMNGDASAVGSGLLGAGVARAVEPVPPAKRSLSAMAWTALAKPEGFDLVRHTVFFSRRYGDEFDRIFQRRELPDEPTTYICAQDRGDDPAQAPTGPERLLILVNAPATGDGHDFPQAERDACETRMLALLRRCGLTLSLSPTDKVLTTPSEFNQLFPATGGALYGRASHGWAATFERPDGRTSLPGLYLAGGSVHPGPGVPMAGLSGRLAAQALLSDLPSTRRSRPVVISGGMSMR